MDLLVAQAIVQAKTLARPAQDAGVDQALEDLARRQRHELRDITRIQGQAHVRQRSLELVRGRVGQPIDRQAPERQRVASSQLDEPRDRIDREAPVKLTRQRVGLDRCQRREVDDLFTQIRDGEQCATGEDPTGTPDICGDRARELLEGRDPEVVSVLDDDPRGATFGQLVDAPGPSPGRTSIMTSGRAARRMGSIARRTNADLPIPPGPQTATSGARVSASAKRARSASRPTKTGGGLGS
jgi:hypothetical protein